MSDSILNATKNIAGTAREVRARIKVQAPAIRASITAADAVAGGTSETLDLTLSQLRARLTYVLGVEFPGSDVAVSSDDREGRVAVLVFAPTHTEEYLLGYATDDEKAYVASAPEAMRQVVKDGMLKACERRASGAERVEFVEQKAAIGAFVAEYNRHAESVCALLRGVNAARLVVTLRCSESPLGLVKRLAPLAGEISRAHRVNEKKDDKSACYARSFLAQSDAAYAVRSDDDLLP